MSLKVVIFSADTIRGSMIQKTLERWVDIPANNASTQAGHRPPGSRQSSSGQSGDTPNEDKIPVMLLLKDLRYIAEILTREKPAVVVLDTKGYFQGELEKFRNGCAQLFAQAIYFKVLAIGSSEHKDSPVFGDVVNDWCLDTPIDPALIVSKVKRLLAADAESGIDENGQADSDDLMDNLMGFLNIK